MYPEKRALDGKQISRCSRVCNRESLETAVAEEYSRQLDKIIDWLAIRIKEIKHKFHSEIHRKLRLKCSNNSRW